MTESQANRFETHRPRLQTHAGVCEAARDLRLTTEFLVELAAAKVRRERADEDDDSVNLALLVLQQRTAAAADVIGVAYDLLSAADSALRQLGAQVLRESPGLDSAPHPHSAGTVVRLARAIESETDDEVLLWLLSAVAWQGHPAGLPVLLGFRDDPRPGIRATVAGNVLLTTKRDEAVPREVVEALLAFAGDAYAGIRWSVIYDIGDWIEKLAAHDPLLRRVVERALADPDEAVRAQAVRALAALESGVPPE